MLVRMVLAVAEGVDWMEVGELVLRLQRARSETAENRNGKGISIKYWIDRRCCKE